MYGAHHLSWRESGLNLACVRESSAHVFYGGLYCILCRGCFTDKLQRHRPRCPTPTNASSRPSYANRSIGLGDATLLPRHIGALSGKPIGVSIRSRERFLKFKANCEIKTAVSEQEIFCLPSQAPIQAMLILRTNAPVLRFPS